MRKNNKKPLWTMDNQGQLHFDEKSRFSKFDKRPESLWYHNIFLFGVIAFCLLADFASFNQLFGSFLFEAPLMRWGLLVGFLVVFDVGPVYLGINYRKMNQGYNITRAAFIAAGAAFVIAAIFSIWLRIVFRSEILPNLADITSSIFGQVESGGGEAKGALEFAVVSGLIPVMTSLVSFYISFTLSNPLREELIRLEEKHHDITDSIGQIESVLREYEADSNYLERLTKDDNDKYEAMQQLIFQKSEYYRDYVRERIKEHLGAPASTSLLSGPLEKVR